MSLRDEERQENVDRHHRERGISWTWVVILVILFVAGGVTFALTVGHAAPHLLYGQTFLRPFG